MVSWKLTTFEMKQNGWVLLPNFISDEFEKVSAYNTFNKKLMQYIHFQNSQIYSANFN